MLAPMDVLHFVVWQDGFGSDNESNLLAHSSTYLTSEMRKSFRPQTTTTSGSQMTRFFISEYLLIYVLK